MRVPVGSHFHSDISFALLVLLIVLRSRRMVLTLMVLGGSAVGVGSAACARWRQDV